MNPILFSLLILSWNIRYDNPADGPDAWPLRKNALVSYIQQRSPDVFGLQEVLQAQLMFVQSQFQEYSYVGKGRDDGDTLGEYSPIFYKKSSFKLFKTETRWLSPTPDKPSKAWDAALPRIATLAWLTNIQSGKTILVINTHFDHIGIKARSEAASLLIKWIKTEQLPVVLIGDLNATPDEEPILTLEKRLAEAGKNQNKPTFNAFNITKEAEKRIDYCFYDARYWSCTWMETPRPMVNNRHTSDHFPIVIQLDVKQ